MYGFAFLIEYARAILHHPAPSKRDFQSELSVMAKQQSVIAAAQLPLETPLPSSRVELEGSWPQNVHKTVAKRFRRPRGAHKFNILPRVARPYAAALQQQAATPASETSRAWLCGNRKIIACGVKILPERNH